MLDNHGVVSKKECIDLNVMACENMDPNQAVVPNGHLDPCQNVSQKKRRRRRRRARRNASCTNGTSVSVGAYSTEFVLGNDFIFRLPIRTALRMEKVLKDDNMSVCVRTTFEVVNATQSFEEMCLCKEAQRMLDTPNAGGDSVASEVISYEIMHRAFRAILEDTEMEIDYWPPWGKITDYAINVFGLRVGVSVTRAMKYKGEFTDSDGEQLLEKKLFGVNASTERAVKKWQKQILHVWCQNARVAHIMERCFAHIDPDLRSNTIMLMTITNTPWIY